MRPLRTPRTLVAPIALGGLLLLGACSAGETVDEPEESPSPTAEADAEADAGADGETEDTQADGETGDDGATSSGGAACVEGDWEVDLASVLDATLSAPGLAELEPEIDVTGESTVTFADGEFTTEYAEQTTSLTWAMEGQEFSSTTTYDGRLTGTYEVTDAELTMSELDTSGVTFTSTTTVNGEEIELGTDDMVQDAFSMGGTSTYECTDSELRLTPAVDGVDTSGFVSVLTRR
jgi:hypothetical protein